MVYDVNIFLVPTDEESLGDGNQLELLNTDNGSSIQIAGQGYYSNLEGIDASLGGTEPGHGDGKVTMKVTMKNPLTQDKSNYLVFAVINAGVHNALSFAATLSLNFLLRIWMRQIRLRQRCS